MFGARFLVAGALALLTISAQARDINFGTLINPDPRAIEAGIFFHSSLLQPTRKLIVEDLSWLAAQGTLRNSERLGEVLGIQAGPLTGAQIVAWLLGNISLIGSLDLCLNGSQFVISQPRPNRMILFQVVSLNIVTQTRCFDTAHSNFDAITDMPLIGTTGWRNARMNEGEVDAFFVDGSVLILANARNQMPIVWINVSRFGTAYGESIGSPMAQRILRISTLIHESQHINRGGGHIPCDQQSLRGLRLGGWKMGKYQDCDANLFGAYPTEAEFVHVMLENCAECTDNLEKIYISDLESWGRTDIQIKHPITLSSVPGLADVQEVAGKVLSKVPPRRFFEERLRQIAFEEREAIAKGRCKNPSTCNTERWRAEVKALLSFLDGLRGSGDIDATWDTLPHKALQLTSVDPSVAIAWTRAASAASAEGYNIPLKWVSPCARFSDGCPY